MDEKIVTQKDVIYISQRNGRSDLLEYTEYRCTNNNCDIERMICVKNKTLTFCPRCHSLCVKINQ